MPHLVATLIYLSQNYSYYIRGDRSSLKTITYIKHCVTDSKNLMTSCSSASMTFHPFRWRGDTSSLFPLLHTMPIDAQMNDQNYQYATMWNISLLLICKQMHT